MASAYSKYLNTENIHNDLVSYNCEFYPDLTSISSIKYSVGSPYRNNISVNFNENNDGYKVYIVVDVFFDQAVDVDKLFDYLKKNGRLKLPGEKKHVRMNPKRFERAENICVGVRVPYITFVEKPALQDKMKIKNKQIYDTSGIIVRYISYGIEHISQL